MDRMILHSDINACYASIELLRHPELRGRPVAVGGEQELRHGIILAKNEPAKRLGIQTAETIWQAKKKCPGLVLLPPHHGLYREYSRRVNTIYEQYTDLVEPFGIDESWLDITGSMHLFGGDPKAIADALRRRLRQELGLTISVGVHNLSVLDSVTKNFSVSVCRYVQDLWRSVEKTTQFRRF